jgi:hypothetical protein
MKNKPLFLHSTTCIKKMGFSVESGDHETLPANLSTQRAPMAKVP